MLIEEGYAGDPVQERTRESAERMERDIVDGCSYEIGKWLS